MILRAVCYARVSSAAQRERDTIAAQIRELPVYVARMGWTLVRPVETYVDDGFTAKAGHLEARAGLAALLRDAALGLFDVVAVVDVDRLTRSEDLIERNTILGLLQRAKVRVASMFGGDVIDMNTSHGDLTVAIKAYVAAEEQRKRRERNAGARVTMMARGRKPTGLTPYGLRFDTELGAWSLDPDRATAVVEIYERIAAGDSCYRIACDFDARDVPRSAVGPNASRTPGMWTRSRVWELATSRHTMGQWTADTKTRTMVAVPPIVSEDLWQRAQDAMTVRRRIPPRRTKHVYLLEGMARCGLCGGPMLIRTNRRPGQQRYVCRHRRERRKRYEHCAAPSVSVADVDARVWAALCAKVHESGLAGELALRRAERDSEARDWDGDAAAARAHLAKLDRKETGLLGRYQRDLISDDALDEALRVLRRERVMVRAQLETAERAVVASETAQQRLVSAEAVIERLRRVMPHATAELQRELVVALVDAGSVTFDGAIVSFDVLMPRVPARGGFGVGGSSMDPTPEPLRLRLVA